MRPLVMLMVLAALGGCRFTIDAVPARDRLTETVVLEDKGLGWSAPKVAMIDVTGVIANANRPGLIGLGDNPVAVFTEALTKAECDSKVRAVLVRINSPGGTVGASEVMYSELKAFRERTGKPVVVLMGDVAASGGYYLACAGDHIMAHPTTITGSIGVIMQLFDVSEGLGRIGIKANAITSGPNKATGSPFAPMSAEQRALLQGIVDEYYAAFVEVVKAARPEVSAEALPMVTDGRVVTGWTAQRTGLVDAVGDLRDAFAATKREAELSGARLVKYHRPIEYVGSAYSKSPAAPTGPTTQIGLIQVNLAKGWQADQPGFYYLWDPAAW